MKLRLDTSRSYALALEGGGAKGAYQIGAWKALREAGVKIDAVAGTSVGALNGSLIVMGDLEKAENIWENIRYSQVMDVDDDAPFEGRREARRARQRGAADVRSDKKPRL